MIVSNSNNCKNIITFKQAQISIVYCNEFIDKTGHCLFPDRLCDIPVKKSVL